MKANELMIGDWVECTYWTPSKQLKVAEIRRIMDDETKIGVYSDDLVLIFRQSEVKPIPLTPEILEKNGMHLYNRKTNDFREECNHCDCFDEDEDFRLELSLDDNGKIRWSIYGDEYTIIPLDYVHQLQQALRLCGIPKEIEL